MNKERVLVVAAHPDDELLGAGATIAKHRKGGDQVFILILGEGITARFNSRQEGLKQADRELRNLRGQMQKAHRILGVTKTFVKTLPDNRFDSVPLLDIVKVVEEVKSKTRPTIVYTHHHADLNVDHRQTFNAVMTAFRPIPGEPIKKILSFFVLSSSEWNAPLEHLYFRPSVFVDINRYLDSKIKALACYKQEMRKFPHPRSLEGIRTAAKFWGMISGMEAAEPFTLIRDRSI